VAELPDVPTPLDIGLKNADSAFWLGVFMPAKTPRDIVEKFHTAGEKLLAEPETQAALKKLGVETQPMTTTEMAAFMARETEDFMTVVKAAGIQP
jgi:tripartite-type tricarboxylate transporter receptor subunit TctC